MARKASYEVHLFRDNRWLMDSVLGDEAKARALAQGLLKEKKNDGVRVIKEWQRSDGNFYQDMVLEQIKRVEVKRDIAPSEISSAPPCAQVADLHRWEARNACNRVLRKYLDEAALTPTELLHNHRELKRLLDMDIAPVAIDRVATAQATAHGGDARQRRDALMALLDGAVLRARRASEGDLPRIGQGGLAGALTLDRSADADLPAMVAFCRRLADLRSWPAKLEELLAQVDTAVATDAARAVTLLDGLVADVMAGRSVVTDLIGSVAHIGALIMQVIDLSEGKLAVERRGEDDAAVALNRHLGAGRLPQTGLALADHAMRLVKSTQPLARNEPPNTQMDVFRQAILRMATPDALFGGPAMAEAMVLRYARFLSRGGAPGRQEAVETVAGMLAPAVSRVRFLTALLETGTGTETAATIGLSLDTLIGKAKHLDVLVQPRVTPKVKMLETAATYRLLLAAPLPADLARRLADRVDDLLAAYLVESKIIEKLDRPEDPLRVRATRLIQFCASGILTEGKAFNLAHERVLAHLRQPEFEERLVEDIPEPAGKDQAVREFHALLATANFFK